MFQPEGGALRVVGMFSLLVWCGWGIHQAAVELLLGVPLITLGMSALCPSEPEDLRGAVSIGGMLALLQYLAGGGVYPYEISLVLTTLAHSSGTAYTPVTAIFISQRCYFL